MTERLLARRRRGVKRFWAQERERIINGLPLTRKWSKKQKEDILSGRTARFMGKSLQAHHTYSVKLYPHLADKGEVLYPVTFEEHLNDWHGGDWKASLPGRRIKPNNLRRNEK